MKITFCTKDNNYKRGTLFIIVDDKEIDLDIDLIKVYKTRRMSQRCEDTKRMKQQIEAKTESAGKYAAPTVVFSI